jgi:hypothetical protein
LSKITTKIVRYADIKFNEQTIQEYPKEGIQPPRGELFKKEMHDKLKAKNPNQRKKSQCNYFLFLLHIVGLLYKVCKFKLLKITTYLYKSTLV